MAIVARLGTTRDIAFDTSISLTSTFSIYTCTVETAAYYAKRANGVAI
jgi:hypothetical protein